MRKKMFEVIRDLRKKHPTRVIEEAVKGMLPKTKLGRAMFQKLKVYAGDKHPHQAQQPQPVTLPRVGTGASRTRSKEKV